MAARPKIEKDQMREREREREREQEEKNNCRSQELRKFKSEFLQTFFIYLMCLAFWLL